MWFTGVHGVQIWIVSARFCIIVFVKCNFYLFSVVGCRIASGCGFHSNSSSRFCMFIIPNMKHALLLFASDSDTTDDAEQG